MATGAAGRARQEEEEEVVVKVEVFQVEEEREEEGEEEDGVLRLVAGMVDGMGFARGVGVRTQRVGPTHHKKIQLPPRRLITPAIQRRRRTIQQRRTRPPVQAKRRSRGMRANPIIRSTLGRWEKRKVQQKMLANKAVNPSHRIRNQSPNSRIKQSKNFPPRQTLPKLPRTNFLK